MTDDTGSHQSASFLPPPIVTEPGDLIAAVPYLLGFYPTDSIVVSVVRNGRVDCTLRVDYPTKSTLYRTIAGQLVHEIGDRHGARVAIVIVGAPTDGHALAAALTDAFTAADVPVDVFGIQAIVHGARWFDYHHPDRGGAVPDPTTSALAAHAAAKGLVTLPNRDALVAQVAADPDDVLARRAALLDTTPVDKKKNKRSADGWVDWIRHHYLARVLNGEQHFTDTDIVDLSRALTSPAVRDRCLTLLIGPHAAAAEALWTILTRQCPPPACADAAALLAISAYSRGDGTLASIALDRALTAHPGHRLALLLRLALDTGFPPRGIRRLIMSSAEPGA